LTPEVNPSSATVDASYPLKEYQARLQPGFLCFDNKTIGWPGESGIPTMSRRANLVLAKARHHPKILQIHLSEK